MAKCANCGTELEEGAKFCLECGTPVPQTKKCIKCGFELPLAAKFCPECGTRQDGTANAGGSGFSMGDKNVIAGDVIGHKEETHIAGNATIIKNEDQTKQVKKCHICGSIVQIVNGFDCPECKQFTCEDCYDQKNGCCKNCSADKEKQKIDRYKEALSMVLADGKIENSERIKLIELQRTLKLDSELASKLENEMRNADGQKSTELTINEKKSFETAFNLFYIDSDYQSALKLIEPVYQVHNMDEKVLELYLPILAEANPRKALEIINNLSFDILSAFIVAIVIYIREKELTLAEEKLKAALRIWYDSSRLKCYQAIFNLAMFKQWKDESFFNKAKEVSANLGEPQDEIDLSLQVKVQTLLASATGESVPELSKEFCEQNNLYWYIINKDYYISNPNYAISNDNESGKKQLDSEPAEDEQEDEISQTKIVGSGKGCNYSSIQQAINDAEPDEEIYIRPGIYKEALLITKPVKLIGCEQSIIKKSSPELPIIVLDKDTSCEIAFPCEFRGIVFTHKKNLQFVSLEKYKPTGDLDGDYLFGLSITSDAVFDNCGIVQMCRAGIEISDCNPKINNCLIMGQEYPSSNEIGILCKDGASPLIENCTFLHFGTCGLYVSELKDPLFGLFDDPRGPRCNPIVRECEFFATGDYGIFTNSSGSYENCSIHDVSTVGIGIEINHSHGAIVKDCEISGCSTGIVIDSGSNKDCISNCNIHDNDDGIEISSGYEGEKLFVDCDIYNNEYGIKLTDESIGTFKTCKLHDNRFMNVDKEDGSVAELDDCDVS